MDLRLLPKQRGMHACIRVEAGFESRSQLQGAATPNAYLITIVEVAALHRLTR